jgi:ribosome-binding factor A
VSGGEIGKKYTITASTQDKTTSALITITEPSKRNPQNSGLISDVKMTSDFGEDDQVFFEPSTRIIYINKKHRINKYLMSRIENCEQYTDLPNSERKYLLDLIAGEIATVLVKEINMRKHNDISFDEDPEESYDKIQHLVQLQKNKIYEVMTPEMLDK